MGSVAAVLAAAFLLNAAVDPMWHFRGNRLGSHNYIFNERVSKLVQFVDQQDLYDCVILGASNATLLHPDWFEGYRCYNLSVSGGRIEELVEYAEYLHARGFEPAMVVVGVDFRNLLSPGNPEVPEFVLERREPPGPLQHYLSLDATWMSLRAVARRSPLPRYYDEAFRAQILDTAPRYDPPECVSVKAPGQPLHTEKVELYSRVAGLFPRARTVGYVPPLSAWRFVGDLQLVTPHEYAAVMKEISAKFDVFYDFAVPGRVTNDRSRTYDGLHYDLDANREIADALQGRPLSGFGIRVTDIDADAYAERIEAAVSEFFTESSYRECAP